MAIFLSAYTNRIDRKSRVSVPAQFRAALSDQSFQGIIAFKSRFSQSIDACGMDRMERLSQEMDDKRLIDSFLNKQNDVTIDVFSETIMLQFDQDGRISLPKELMIYAGLCEYACFVGRGPTFQIWNPEKFEEYKQSTKK